MTRKKYRWRIVWLVVWLGFTITVIGVAVFHLYTGASSWRLLFDALQLFIAVSSTIDRWNGVKKARTEIIQNEYGHLKKF